MKQTSENKLFNLFFKKLVNQSSQNNLCHQIRFDSIRIQINLVSLLQRRCQCDDLSTHIALPISEPAYLVFLCQLVSLLQWHDQNRPLRWASRSSSSEPATKALSMRWSTYPHRLTYQWTWSYVHMQIVSLLQWQAESWSLQWASRLVSLLQWHSSSMRWSTYSHRPTYQWTGLPRVHVQLVSLLQWSSYFT